MIDKNSSRSTPDESGTSNSSNSESATPTPSRPRTLSRDIALYTAGRLLLFAALTAAIVGIGQIAGITVPIFVAGILALIAALPLSMMIFVQLRARINAGISDIDAERQERKETLRRRLEQGGN